MTTGCINYQKTIQIFRNDTITSAYVLIALDETVYLNNNYFQAFSVNGQPTIRTIDPAFQTVIGNAPTLSFRDIKLANLMYNCAGTLEGIYSSNMIQL